MATFHQAPPTLVLRAGSVVMTATEVRRAVRIFDKALSSSARLTALHGSAPRLTAWAAKSTPEPPGHRLLNEALPQARCNRLMQPKPPLSSRTMLSFLSSAIDVAISEFIIR